MTLFSRILGRVLKLPPAQTRDVVVRKDLRVPMRDGVVLLADHYAPRGGEGRLPTVLIRGPYGRRSGGLLGRLIAERGYQLLLQGVRGTDGSGGTFGPFRQERDDGLDALRWIEEQPWYSESLVTFGASYLGFTQWAIAAGAGDRLKAMSVQVAFSDFYDAVYPGGAFALQTFMGWISLMSKPSVLGYLSRLIRGDRKYERALDQLPLRDVDRTVTGKEVLYYRRWLEHDASGDSWWSSARHSDAVAQVSAPVHLLGGWYDFFLPHTMRDYASLRCWQAALPDDRPLAPFELLLEWRGIERGTGGLRRAREGQKEQAARPIRAGLRDWNRRMAVLSRLPAARNAGRKVVPARWGTLGAGAGRPFPTRPIPLRPSRPDPGSRRSASRGSGPEGESGTSRQPQTGDAPGRTSLHERSAGSRPRGHRDSHC